MGKLYAKQPNGLYCQTSSVVDAFTIWGMTKEELKKDIMQRNYGYCCDSFMHMSDHYEEIFEKEIENPKIGGYFLTTFEDCLSHISLSNYKIDQLRNELKQMGYKNWETFMTWDYCADVEREKVFWNVFDEKLDIIKNYLLSYANSSYYIKNTLNPKNISKETYIADINSITSKEDFKKMNTIYEFGDIGYIVEDSQLDKLVNYDMINKKINDQYQELEYTEYF